MEIVAAGDPDLKGQKMEVVSAGEKDGENDLKSKMLEIVAACHPQPSSMTVHCSFRYPFGNWCNPNFLSSFGRGVLVQEPCSPISRLALRQQ